MFRTFGFALAPIVVVALALDVHAQDASKSAEDFAVQYVTAYNGGDGAAVAALFTADGVFNAPSGAVLKGREAVAKAIY